MNNIYITILIIASLIFSACNSTEKRGDSEQKQNTESLNPVTTNIPFIEAKHYFVRNDYEEKDLHLLKITSREDFDKIFGMAAVMGKDGMPTNIDFARQYVIAVIGKTTNNSAALDVSDLVKSNDTIMVNYKYTEGEKLTYSLRPFKVLIVDSQNQGELKLQCE